MERPQSAAFNFFFFFFWFKCELNGSGSLSGKRETGIGDAIVDEAYLWGHQDKSVWIVLIVFLPETPPTDKHPNTVGDLISQMIQFVWMEPYKLLVLY